MKEEDYILVSDLKAIRIVESLLFDVIPANNPLIDEDEYQAVKRTLKKWRDAMFEKVNKRDE